MSTLCIQLEHPDWPGEPVGAMVTVDKDMKPIQLVIMRWQPIEHYSPYITDQVAEAIRTGNFA